MSKELFGLDADQAPLNLHLGDMAYQNSDNVALQRISTPDNLVVTNNGLESFRLTQNWNVLFYQPAESPQNTSATLSIAQLRSRIITSNAAVTLTLPTGADLETYTFTTMSVNTAFEVTFIATAANAITIAANGNTTVGSLTVAANSSGTFRFRKTATNTFTIYRVA